jgi:predicted RNA methylase
MTQNIKDFFDDYPKFYTTSESGSHNRINHRYRVLIHQHKQTINDSRILDIASHDGRWIFAAIKTGARHVLGREGRKEHIDNCNTNFDKYNVEKTGIRLFMAILTSSYQR